VTIGQHSQAVLAPALGCEELGFDLSGRRLGIVGEAFQKADDAFGPRRAGQHGIHRHLRRPDLPILRMLRRLLNKRRNLFGARLVD
jgi:hypothetical protein